MNRITVSNSTNCHRLANVITFQKLKDIRAKIDGDVILTVQKFGHTEGEIYELGKREKEREDKRKDKRE